MPMPADYQRAQDQWLAFLEDVRDACQLGSTHQAYTTAQGVLYVFRRRVPVAEAIRFAGVLPGLLRACFVADCEVGEALAPWVPREQRLAEVRALRPRHNFAPDDAITHVAWAVGRQVDRAALAAALRGLPEAAVAYWRADHELSERSAAEWRLLSREARRATQPPSEASLPTDRRDGPV